jgi:hypothetical protein
MKNVKPFVMVATFVALACTSLHAQSGDMRATIPFDFHAGNRLVPAGDYVIHGQGAVVFLRKADSGTSVSSFMTSGTIGRDRSRLARLDFQRYGTHYFLTTIWDPFSQDGRHVHQTAREKELELAKGGDGPIQIAVSLVASE